MKKTERLYLNSWGYNAARILSALAQIIENNGGTIVYYEHSHDYLLTNRSIHEVVEDKQKTVDLLEKHGKSAEKLKAEIEAYKAKHKDEAETPIKCTHKESITFTLDGTYYSYHVDSNPFFDFRFTKAHLIDGVKYDANCYSQEANKDWLYDCFLFVGCSEADIKEAANLIYNELLKAPYSQPTTDRRRVANTYDNKYHYENIHTKRILAIDRLF